MTEFSCVLGLEFLADVTPSIGLKFKDVLSELPPARHQPARSNLLASVHGDVLRDQSRVDLFLLAHFQKYPSRQRAQRSFCSMWPGELEKHGPDPRPSGSPMQIGVGFRR